MRLTRIYQDIPLKLDSTIQLDLAASHRITTVLRLQKGEEIIVLNGQGGEYIAMIRGWNKKHIEADLKKFHAREAESNIDIILGQAMVSGEKMDWIVQKSVELGVREIIPLWTERCKMKMNKERIAKRLSHLQAVMVGACEQSGRNRLPKIAFPLSLKDWLKAPNEGSRFVLTPTGPRLNIAKLSGSLPIVLLVGPEGGLSEQELNSAFSSRFLPLNLGPRILRVETASLAALAIFQSIAGDMGGAFQRRKAE